MCQRTAVRAIFFPSLLDAYTYVCSPLDILFHAEQQRTSAVVQVLCCCVLDQPHHNRWQDTRMPQPQLSGQLTSIRHTWCDIIRLTLCATPPTGKKTIATQQLQWYRLYSSTITYTCWVAEEPLRETHSARKGICKNQTNCKNHNKRTLPPKTSTEHMK